MPLQKTTKEDIIKNSIQVFREKGYYRANMSDLAKRSGLTKGAFYYHFSNKEDVMLQSLQMTSRWFDQNIFSIAYLENLTGKEKFKKMSERIFNAFVRRSGGCFFANTILETAHIEDTFKAELIKFFDLWEKSLSVIFEEKYSTNQISALSSQVMADIEGSIILMQLRNDSRYLQNALKRTMDLLK